MFTRLCDDETEVWEQVVDGVEGGTQLSNSPQRSDPFCAFCIVFLKMSVSEKWKSLTVLPRRLPIRSIGSGNMIVEFFSADIEFSVCKIWLTGDILEKNIRDIGGGLIYMMATCRYRSCNAEDDSAMTSLACATWSSWLTYSADSYYLDLSVLSDLRSMTNASMKYERTQQGNLLNMIKTTTSIASIKSKIWSRKQYSLQWNADCWNMGVKISQVKLDTWRMALESAKVSDI